MNKNLGPIILDLTGLELSKEEESLITHPLVGGIIIFSRNYDNPNQLSALIQHIRNIRPELILCVDQEGGRVQRLQNQFTRLPHMKILGDLFDRQRFSIAKMLEICEQMGFLMAVEVRAIDLDLSFAPVLDINKGVSEIMRDRAIHHDPSVIAQLASAYIKGMHRAGMSATGKHFPGHGHVKADSHLELPVDSRDFIELKKDMAPFQTLAHELDAIMTAHIRFPEVDKLPASFSPFWLQTVLREQIGFKGTIVSDDLTMEGASCMGDYAQRAQAALAAGCDFILICNNRDGALIALESITDEVNDMTYERRANLQAKKIDVHWQQLKQNKDWLEACKFMEIALLEPV